MYDEFEREFALDGEDDTVNPDEDTDEDELDEEEEAATEEEEEGM